MNFDSRDPVYLQIVRYFKERIAIGELVPGQEIQSRRELASLMKVNPNTVQRAYKEMEDQGFIHTERNHPSKITTNQGVLGMVREELLAEAVEVFVASVKSIHVPVEELLEMVREKYLKDGE